MTRSLSLVIFVIGAGMLLDPIPSAVAKLQPPLIWGFGVVLVLAGVSLAVGSAVGTPAIRSGIVVLVEHDTGTVALQHADGTLSHLTADPGLLGDIRFGEPVRAVVEGNVARAFRRSAAAWRRDRRPPEGTPPSRRNIGAGGWFHRLTLRRTPVVEVARKEVSMNLPTAFALLCLTLLGVEATLNADLVSMRFPLATGYGTVSAPVILVLILIAVGSGFLFVLVTSVSQGILRRKIEQVSAALAERERELLQLKATIFDESMETLQSVSVRLDRRLRDLEPLLAGRKGELAAHAGGLGSRAA